MTARVNVRGSFDSVLAELRRQILAGFTRIPFLHPDESCDALDTELLTGKWNHLVLLSRNDKGWFG